MLSGASLSPAVAVRLSSVSGSFPGEVWDEEVALTGTFPGVPVLKSGRERAKGELSLSVRYGVCPREGP